MAQQIEDYQDSKNQKLFYVLSLSHIIIKEELKLAEVS